MLRKLLVLSLIALSCSACQITGSKDEKGDKDGKGGDDEDTEYTYEFEYNGCNTGRHTFASKSEYCNALTDEALNNGCAQEQRYQAYQTNCDSGGGGGDGDGGGGDSADDPGSDAPPMMDGPGGPFDGDGGDGGDGDDSAGGSVISRLVVEGEGQFEVVSAFQGGEHHVSVNGSLSSWKVVDGQAFRDGIKLESADDASIVQPSFAAACQPGKVLGALSATGTSVFQGMASGDVSCKLTGDQIKTNPVLTINVRNAVGLNTGTKIESLEIRIRQSN